MTPQLHLQTLTIGPRQVHGEPYHGADTQSQLHSHTGTGSKIWLPHLRNGYPQDPQTTCLR